MTTSCGNEMCNTAIKTTVICKRGVKQTVLSPAGFGQIYQQEITVKHIGSKEVSILRQRWIGYRINNSGEYNSPSVFLKCDEIVYPFSTQSAHEESPKCMVTSSMHSHKEPERKLCRWWTLFLMCFILSVVLISIHLLFQNTCNKVFNIEKLRGVLDENVFGQDEIKDQLIRTIETMNSPMDSDVKFLIFSGSSGVGKTYVASLIAQFFPWSENVQHFMAPVHSELSAGDIDKRMSLCGYNLVIIDDLKKSDVNMMLELKRNYELMNRQFLKVIFIFIFTTEQNFIANDIDNSFSTQLDGSSLTFCGSVTHFQFKQLEEEDILKFIKKSVYEKGLTEPQILIDEFINSFLSPSFRGGGGCKRISSKLALFLEMYEQKKLRANFQ
ncbi:uncharacterized protein LOC126161752 [Schistocerca cancellata]|uniref:uncharacterized protein LOC126161752 n=1 Tax=Schistocerca cancellata TaxID=274614 RepID=UPI002118B7E4|nr:uncharacterized protein LOC126161752 [Schistocerca cancellata]